MRPDVKKLVLSLLPYVFLAWLFGKAAECYRLSAGADMVTKLMGAVSGLGDLLSANPLPSFHPRDLFFGLCAAAAIRAAVYLKGKNAKKYRQIWPEYPADPDGAHHAGPEQKPEVQYQ